jgi:capsule polysaccharide modification protein KpsS
VQFPSQKNFLNDVLMSFVEKAKQKYILLLLNNYIVIITSIDLWMSKGAHDIFALVLIF